MRVQMDSMRHEWERNKAKALLGEVQNAYAYWIRRRGEGNWMEATGINAHVPSIKGQVQRIAESPRIVNVLLLIAHKGGRIERLVIGEPIPRY